jgi:hypothetical protein
MALMILMPFRNTHGFHDRRIVRNIPWLSYFEEYPGNHQEYNISRLAWLFRIMQELSRTSHGMGDISRLWWSDDLMISGLLWICQDLMIVMTVMTVRNTHASHDLWSMIYDLMTPLNVSWLLQDILNTQDSYDSYDCQEWSGISLECLGFLGFQEHFKTKDSIRLSGVWHGSQDSWWLSMIAMTARRISRPMISRLPWIGHDSYDCQEDLRASMISRLAWRSQDSYDCREYAMGLRNIPWVSYTLEW